MRPWQGPQPDIPTQTLLVLSSKPSVCIAECEEVFCSLYFLTLAPIVSFVLHCSNFSLPDPKLQTNTLGFRWLSQTAPQSLSCLHVLIICRAFQILLMANKLTGEGHSVLKEGCHWHWEVWYPRRSCQLLAAALCLQVYILLVFIFPPLTSFACLDLYLQISKNTFGICHLNSTLSISSSKCCNSF